MKLEINISNNTIDGVIWEYADEILKNVIVAMDLSTVGSKETWNALGVRYCKSDVIQFFRAQRFESLLLKELVVNVNSIIDMPSTIYMVLETILFKAVKNKKTKKILTQLSDTVDKKYTDAEIQRALDLLIRNGYSCSKNNKYA